jgi:hypothetical protein
VGGEETFAGAPGNSGVAPIAAVRASGSEPSNSIPQLPFMTARQGRQAQPIFMQLDE